MLAFGRVDIQQEAVQIVSDEVALTVLPGAGARMHSLTVRGHELLRRPNDPAEHMRNPFFWGGYVMAPWCNRITPGPVVLGGRTVDLPANFRDGSAIHGQVHSARWQRTSESAFEIEREGEGWPWRYRVAIEYAVAGTRVAVALRLRNLDDAAMPGGIGIHPWFPVPVEARINAALTYGSNANPLDRPVPVSGDLDVRQRTALAEGVDATWTDTSDPPIELFWPNLGLRAKMRAPFSTLHVTAAYASDLGAIAVEPQTQAAQGLRRLVEGQPGAMGLIAPGEEMVLPITIDFDWPT